MPSYQQVRILGHASRDPEIKFTPNNMCIAKFGVPVNERYKDKSGEWQEKTEWFNVVVFGKSAENYVAKYLHKGGLVEVVGKLRTNTYQDKKYTDLVADDVIIFPSRDGDNAQQTSRQTSAPAPQRQERQPEPQRQRDFDEDIPFAPYMRGMSAYLV